VRFRPPVLSYDDIRKRAEEFLEEYHEERTLPVPLEEIVEFDFEIEIVPILGLQRELRVAAFLASDMKRIYVDEEVITGNPERYRFSLAHEVAHFWLHDSLYEQVKIESVADWRRVQSDLGADYSWFEFQANAFAGLVLVPEEILRHEFRQAAHEAASAGVPTERLVLFPARQHLIRRLATRFAVNEQVMEIRLEKDGHLPPLG
jgi:Zn-dependent peptidase ImmA (M78 family)